MYSKIIRLILFEQDDFQKYRGNLLHLKNTLHCIEHIQNRIQNNLVRGIAYEFINKRSFM